MRFERGPNSILHERLGLRKVELLGSSQKVATLLQRPEGGVVSVAGD